LTLRINATPVDEHEREVRTTLHPVLHALEHYITSCLAGIGALHYHCIITTLHPALQALEHCIEALHYILHYITSCLTGIGAGFVPGVLNTGIYDEILQVGRQGKVSLPM